MNNYSAPISLPTYIPQQQHYIRTSYNIDLHDVSHWLELGLAKHYVHYMNNNQRNKDNSTIETTNNSHYRYVHYNDNIHSQR